MIRSQIKKIAVEANRIPIGEHPTYELELDDNQRVLGVAYQHSSGGKKRTTEDWTIWLWVESRIKVADETDK